MATDKFKKQIIIDEKGAKKTGSNISSMLKTFGGIAGATVLLKGMYNGMKKNVEMSIKQQQTFKELETAVNLTGVTYKDNKKELDALFASQQALTQYGDTDSAEMFKTLAQITGDYDKSLKGLPLAQDLAATGLFDMATASRYVGLAMQGEVSVLGRYVAELKVSNPEMAKLTTQAEIAEYAMKILNEKFGGTAQRNVKTTAGSIQQLKNYYGDLREEIGDKLSPTIGKIARAWTGWVQAILETPFDTTIRQMQEMGISAENINGAIARRDAYEATKNLRNNYNNINRAIKRIPVNLKLSNTELRSFAKTVFGLQDEVNEFGELIPIKDSVQFAENLQVAIDETNNRFDEQSTILNNIEDVNSRKFKKQEALLDDIFQEQQYLLEIKATYEEYMSGVKTLEEAQKGINELKKGETKAVKETTEATEDGTDAVALLGDEYVRVSGIVSGLSDEIQEYLDGQVAGFESSFGQINSIVSNSAQIYDNIIEGRFNKELQAMKDSRAYKKADVDIREKMEQDLNSSYKDERIKAFNLNKAAGISEAIINTAVGVAKALTLLPPASYVLAGLTAVAGAVQVGLIASEPVPAYAEGGMLPYNGQSQVFTANERGQEAILNADATSRLGTSGVDALNSGQSVGNVVNLNIQGNLIVDSDERINELTDRIEYLSIKGFNNIRLKAGGGFGYGF